MVEPRYRGGTARFFAEAIGVDVPKAFVEFWFVGKAFLGERHIGIQDQSEWDGTAAVVALPYDLIDSLESDTGTLQEKIW